MKIPNHPHLKDAQQEHSKEGLSYILRSRNEDMVADLDCYKIVIIIVIQGIKNIIVYQNIYILVMSP